MNTAGIEDMNVFGGLAYLDVTELAKHRKLDLTRFDNLMMKEKSVALQYEDPVSFAVNAAKPIVDKLAEDEKEAIELLIVCSESGIDFSKSISSYVHRYLGLSKTCRLFEIKQACYSQTAGLQMAVNFILSNTSPGAKALVIGTDISRFLVSEGGTELTEDWSYAEPSAGAGAVALLVSEQAKILSLDIGAIGYHGYEVLDTCRPTPDSEAGDADLSLMSYLDCCENTFKEYSRRVEGVDYANSFHYLTYHTPFGGMVKGAHRSMMRKLLRARPADIEPDFERRVAPGIQYCQRVGNIMGATLYMAIASTIDNGEFNEALRLGCFSYGSGCCSEFYSGVVTPEGKALLQKKNMGKHLDNRYRLSMDEYHDIILNSEIVKFGTRNVDLKNLINSDIVSSPEGHSRLILTKISEFKRHYEWVA